ncbi:MAG: SIS domain-containing protein, partial [Clostridiales bacterium]|nr:SIS domain-containing protein [Clostridiales bacterium]
MKEQSSKVLQKLMSDNPALEVCKDDMVKAFELIKKCYDNNGKVLICGNGGSASDSEHIVGELMKGFVLSRPISKEHRKVLEASFPDDADYLSDHLQGALPAISLVSQTSISTAFINDVAPDMVYAQQVYGYVEEGDVVIGISTSGNSKNIINAVKVGNAFGAQCLAMTGRNGGMLKELCEVSLISPAHET